MSATTIETKVVEPSRQKLRVLEALAGIAIMVSLGFSAMPAFRAPQSWPLPLVMLLAWVVLGTLVACDRHLRANGRLAKILVILFAVQTVLGLSQLHAFWPPTWAEYQAGRTGFDACLYHDYAVQLAAQGLRGPGPWDG